MSHGALRLEAGFKQSSDACVITGFEYDGFDQSVPKNPRQLKWSNIQRSLLGSQPACSAAGSAVGERAGGAQRQVHNFSTEKVDDIPHSSRKPGRVSARQFAGRQGVEKRERRG